MPWTEVFRFFYILGFVNAIFFSILIFSKSKRSQADNILGIWLIVLALQFLWPFFYLSDFEKYLLFAGYEITFFILHPILLFMYSKSLTSGIIGNKIILLHLIPFIISIGSFLPFLSFSYNERYDFILNNGQLPHILIPGFILIISIIITYLTLSFKILKQHKNNTLQLYSYRDNVDLLWLRRLLIAFTGINLLSIPSAGLLLLTGYSVILSDYIFYTTLVVFIFFLGYWGYQQGSIFQKSQIKTPFQDSKSTTQNENSYTEDYKKLIQVMERKKPYLNPGLSLNELAELSGYTPHHLSKVINKTFHRNFFEFVNSYRISEFKNLIAQSKNKGYTILGIALECGFNSKSAFNRIFKDQTGQTPGEYKNAISKSDQTT